jgi:hypothetical protein
VRQVISFLIDILAVQHYRLHHKLCKRFRIDFFALHCSRGSAKLFFIHQSLGVGRNRLSISEIDMNGRYVPIQKSVAGSDIHRFGNRGRQFAEFPEDTRNLSLTLCNP